MTFLSHSVRIARGQFERQAVFNATSICRARNVYTAWRVLRRYRSDYEVVVAGAGAAGISAVGNLLDQRVEGQLMFVDPELEGGKIHSTWRDVPSNTMAGRFVEFANFCESLQEIIKKEPKPNAITVLEELDQKETCGLWYAADLCQLLVRRLCELEQVTGRKGKLIGANYDSDSSEWAVELSDPESSSSTTISASKIVLCTGAIPREIPIPVPELNLQRVTLDTAMTQNGLSAALPTDEPTTVAVIGASHTAVLVLLNLYNLATTTHPQLRVRWFTRSKLLYAEFKDGWILYDNTGLKGIAATFAKDNLEDDKLPASDVGRIVTKINCQGGARRERDLYTAHLPACTHAIHATGFVRGPLPALSLDGQLLDGLAFNHVSGRLEKDGKPVPGLFGAGIAFPERVKDPAGNVELAVGMIKFMKFMRKTAPQWLWHANRIP